MTETRPLLSIFLTALLVATMSGCDSFDHPLRWEQSLIADDLVGAWKTAEGPGTRVRARVWRTDDTTLGFEITSPDKKESATFLGNVLEAGSVHVLQVRLDSYKEFDEDGQSTEDPATGFYFWRIVPSPENGVNVHWLSPHAMGSVADKELAASGAKIGGDTFARCLRDDVRDSLRTKTWADVREKLDDRLLAEVQVCVAYRLPSESLEQLFLHHADVIFSGDVTRYVRE